MRMQRTVCLCGVLFHAWISPTNNIIRSGDITSYLAIQNTYLFRLLGECVGTLTFGKGECRQGQAAEEGIVEPEVRGDVFLVREGGDLLLGSVLGESEKSYMN